ncbi:MULTISPECIES: CRISPR-associated helicase Cas3' [unclassified Oceanispirochaeta]|uniref:CRISPR-associated helicase Cas3' n=1 Tax=unclassified Oceanispirochaeta TaxID=2635722 RepID=UPI0013141120|nr:MULTISPECIES: CRISPR-associated helicase Cas3' [unclassified Oceanispirochaeta]MBF9014133.1 CRISPR-associated helicase Cas3' [Oceanispirochaeta sp. M2]NPD70624.1 CRISPR-associated helicase Cas3' [Oceanispirochaeta sp. M1]
MTDSQGKNIPGVDVATHCKIAGLVACELLSRYPVELKDRLFSEGSELVVALHDIGKINPMFQEKIRRNMGCKRNSHPDLINIDPDLEKNSSWHWGISQAALYGLGRFIPEIAGRHHGVSPEKVPLPDDQITGGPPWQNLRNELISFEMDIFGKKWPVIKNDLSAALLSGLTTVSDWIASGSIFDNPDFADSKLTEQVKMAVNYAGFIKPKIKKGLSFTDVFSFSPRPLQTSLIKIVKTPGVYVLEAQMGQGKTEAALFAAYNMMEKGQGTGIYFALPTQLTSEKIHDRVDSFLNKILEKQDRHNTLLLHGNAWLCETDMGEDAKPGYSWYQSRKRGILAPFAVGTIDQALMAVMNVKHGFVRTFGLAGKIVILDEVHTYDAYTGTIMDHLINSLVELDCTVIILSATLTSSRKLKLFNKNDEHPIVDESYPQITAVTKNGDFLKVNPGSEERDFVKIELLSEDKNAYFLTRERAIRGEYILWIENSVDEAQNVYKKLAPWAHENNIKIGLMHSRFSRMERKKLDDQWVEIFGKPGRIDSDGIGKILIGTQVLEQSLDIDADMLITRLAPTDMILQRIGRLWRHRDVDAFRGDESKREAYILSPLRSEIDDDPITAFAISSYIYSPYVLARSFEVWSQEVKICLPDDMRHLIEETYAPRQDVGKLEAVKKELIKEKEKLQRFAFLGMAKAGITRSDLRAATRYSEIQTCDVLLLDERSDLVTGNITFYDGEEIVLKHKNNLTLSDRKNISAILANRIISVPEYKAPVPSNTRDLSWLSPYLYVGDGNESPIRIAILEKSGTIAGFKGNSSNEKYNLSYSKSLGYTAIKKE